MRQLKRIVLYVCLLSLFVCIIHAFRDGQFVLCLLPLMFGISFWTIVPSNAIIGSGLTILVLVELIRFAIYPALSPVQYWNLRFVPYLDLSVLLSIFEILVTTVTIHFFYRNRPTINKSLVIGKISPAIPFILFLFIIFISLTEPSAFANKHFILSTKSIVEKRSETNLSGVSSQFLSWGQIIVISFLFYLFFREYKRTKKKLYYYLSICVVLFPCLFFSGASRLSLLMPVVCAAFVLKKAYGNKSKKLILLICLYGFVALGALSLMKFFRASGLSDSSVDLSQVAVTKLLNAYFGGLENVATGLRAFSDHENSFEVFINDVLRNAMGISQYFIDNPQNSVQIFNNEYYGQQIIFWGDQICPTVIEGLFMFGPFFCLIPTIIMTFFVCWLDYGWNKSDNICITYLYANIASLIGWAVPGNLMHLTSNMFNTFLPVLLLLNINKLFVTQTK